MSLAPGTRLGPYQIAAAIGSGGMGEVYRAIDTRLDRTVAIKVSGSEFSSRFEREARAVAALNHPNICQLYDIGPNYLVMEFVEGQPIGHVDSPRKLLDLAVQIADGMAAAHAASIVHRDLKPDNILVADGRVKILDFGLAKSALQAPDMEGLTQSAGLTTPGTTLGTVAYMSPEQARGEPNLGPQSDQFSFGLLLYEMVTGRRAFTRDSSAETMTAIIREDAEPLPASAPPPLRWVIDRLLSKDPAGRYESSRDLYRELRQVRDRLSQATTAPVAATTTSQASSRRRGVKAAVLLLASFVAGAALAAALLVGRSSPASPNLSRYLFTPVSIEAPTEREPAWSPDGKSIAYLASIDGALQVMTRTVGATQAAQLTHRRRGASSPFWSPDGSAIYFISRADDPDARSWLWSVSVTGGEPERLVEGATSAAIHPDGKTLAFSKGGKIWIGQDPRFGIAAAHEYGLAPFTPPADVQAFSPDGSRLALVKDGALWIVAYPSGQARSFPANTLNVSWMPDSRRLVVSAIPGSNMSLSMLDTTTGASRMFYASQYALLNPAVSPDGRRIAFMGGDVAWTVVEVQVPSGRVRTMPSAGGVSWWPAWAPSGTHYAFVSDRAEPVTVRDVDAETGGGFSRVLAEVEGTGISLNTVRWSPDGHRFSFTLSSRAPGGKLMLANVAGGHPVAADDTADQSRDGVWSPDGEWLVYRRRSGAEEQIVKARPGSKAERVVLKRWPWANAAGQARAPLDWSPDGKWILASGGQSGVFAISAADASERQISGRPTPGRPKMGFSRDGRSVLLLEQNTIGDGAPWRLWSIDVATGAERMLADVPLPPTTGDAAGFSLHPDGTRFLTSIANWPFDIWMLEGFDDQQ